MAWDWPHAVPTHVVQRWTDIQAINALERGSPALRQAWQETALRELLAHATHASAWWRQWLTPTGLQTDPALLTQLPILTREDFRAAIEHGGPLRMPPWHGSTSPKSTSGSSGVPVQLHISQLAGRVVDSHYMADHRRHGRDLRLKLAALQMRFEPHPGNDHHLLPGDDWQGISPILARQTMGASMREHAQWLQRVDPAYLNVWPTVLSGMLDAYEDGLPAPANLQQVMTIGETVTPALRARTRRLLGASIRDRYTCEEIGPIALQCPHDGSDNPRYHVCASNVIVEVVDHVGHAVMERPGRVLVTGLQHWACPAIRYDLGDVASLAPQCSCCGAHVPTLFNLLGRKRFLIRLPSGERIFLNITGGDFLAVAQVREFRIVQTTELTIEVELVLDQPLSGAENAALLAMLRDKIDAGFDFRLRQVDAIAWAPGGKRQDTLSLV